MMKFLLAGLCAVALIFPLGSLAATYSVNWISADHPDIDLSDNSCDISPGGLGRCTLRAAMMQANHNPGVDTIVFSELGTDASTAIQINLTSKLPPITDQVIIDGRTAPGYNASTSILNAIPRIFISGSLLLSSDTFYGFYLNGGTYPDDPSGTQILALGITDFPGTGIVIGWTSDIHISGNWIGVDSDGLKANNTSTAVLMELCENCRVGGGPNGPTTSYPGNLISNNNYGGIKATLGKVEIFDNLVGVDPAGGDDFGNGKATSTIQPGITVTGDLALVRRNRIEHNAGAGILLEEGESIEVSDNEIFDNGVDGIEVHNNPADRGNYYHIFGNQIGMTRDGVNRGNNGDGIKLLYTTVAPVIESNWIGFNSGNGITLEADEALICGNHIGVGESGEPAGNQLEGIWVNSDNNTIGDRRVNCESNRIGFNGSDGLEIWGGSNIVRDNQIGGTAGQAFGNLRGGILLHESDAFANEVIENEIFHNGSAGVRVTSSAGNGNRIEKNTFKANGNINIDLNDDGPTANDFGDPDSGPNNLQNTPIITAQDPGLGTLQVSYGFSSTTTASAYPLTIDFYIDGDSTGNRKTFIQRDIYDETPETVKDITVTLPEGVTAGTLAAMATDADGNSSEFSFPFPFTTKTEDIFEDSFED